MSAQPTNPTLNPADLRAFPRPVVDVLVKAVNGHGVRYRRLDGTHLILYSGDRRTAPFKVSAVRDAEETMRRLPKWLDTHFPSWDERDVVAEDAAVAQPPLQAVSAAPEPPEETAPVPQAVEEPQEPQGPTWDPEVDHGFVRTDEGWACQYPACGHAQESRAGMHLHTITHTDPQEVARRGQAGGQASQSRAAERREEMRQAAMTLLRGRGLVVLDAETARSAERMRARIEALEAQVAALTRDRDDKAAALALLNETFEAVRRA